MSSPCDGCQDFKRPGYDQHCKDCRDENYTWFHVYCTPSCKHEDKVDMVNQPKHYTNFPVEVIDIIRQTLTPEQFIGYCFGNEIKYRMRAGIKDPEKASEDIAKAEVYRAWRIDASKD